MPNNGAVNGAITAVSEGFTIPLGFHDGSGKVALDTTEQSNVHKDRQQILCCYFCGE